MSQLTKKEQYWLNHLTTWQHSGESISRYTQRHKLAQSGFYVWRKRLAPHLDNASLPPGSSLFSPVELVENADVKQTLSIYFPNGCRIELPCQQIQLLGHIMSLTDAQ